MPSTCLPVYLQICSALPTAEPVDIDVSQLIQYWDNPFLLHRAHLCSALDASNSSHPLCTLLQAAYMSSCYVKNRCPAHCRSGTLLRKVRAVAMSSWNTSQGGSMPSSSGSSRAVLGCSCASTEWGGKVLYPLCLGILLANLLAKPASNALRNAVIVLSAARSPLSALAFSNAAACPLTSLQQFLQYESLSTYPRVQFIYHTIA